MSNPEYLRIQVEIGKLKSQLKKDSLPENMRELFNQCHPYQSWAQNFHCPMHPLLTRIEEVNYETISFEFKTNSYVLSFHSESDSMDILEERGILKIQMNGASVLESQFFGRSGEHFTTWRYYDSEVYRPGEWSKDLLRFKSESAQLIEAFRAQQDAVKKRDPAYLNAIREKFNIAEHPPSKGKELRKLFGQLAQALFRR